MKIEKRLNKKEKNNNIFLYSFLIITCLVFVGCNDLLEPPQNNNGTGYFSLTLDRLNYGRTILPTNNQSDFQAYTLEFYTAGVDKNMTNPLLIISNRTNDNLSEVIQLDSGPWDLYVTAYLDEGKLKPAAKGELKDIQINTGKTTIGTIKLNAIINSGTGTFKWDINFPSDVNTASMTIIGITEDGVIPNSTQTLFFIQNGVSNIGKNDNMTLEAGQYRIIFKLIKSNGLYTERWETLHVYQNMESSTDEQLLFRDSHFVYGFVSVNNISGVPNEVMAHSQLVLSPTVQPINATKQDIEWSIKNGNGTGASISGSILSTSSNGKIIITANITDGTEPWFDYTQDFEITVNPVIVSNIDINITPPVNGALPNTTASTTNENTNFTIGVVTWTPEHSRFRGNTEYAANVRLTANSGYTFTGINTITINGQNLAKEFVSNNGSYIILTRKFQTENTIVTNIEIKNEPSRLNYVHGDLLDLTGLVVTLTYDDTSTEDVTATGLNERNISTNPAHGNHLIHITNNNKPITITYGELPSLHTNNIFVSPKVTTFAIDTIGAVTYNRNNHTPIVNVYDGTLLLVKDIDYTISYGENLNAGNDAGTVNINGIRNYLGSSRTASFTINPKVVTFSVDMISSRTYNGSAHKPEVRVWDTTTELIENTDYTINYGENINAGTNAGTIGVTGKGNYLGSSASTSFTINKAVGEAVSSPTLQTVTQNSITVNAVTTSTGQTVQYARNTYNSSPSSGWQTSTIFTGLNASTTYYIFARSEGNNNYETGTTSSGLSVTTKIAVPNNRFEYYWVDAHGSLVTTSGGTTTIASGETLTIIAQGIGYIVRQWHLNGVNTGHNGNTFDFSSTTTGRHTVGLFVEKDGIIYNTNITINVISVPITRSIKIDMYDAYGDGWNAGGALRIFVNGNQITSVSVSQFTNTYTFTANVGDVIQVYWYVGTGTSYQYENSFIIYYENSPPSPQFYTGSLNSQNNVGPTNWSGSGSLLHRLRTTTSSGIASGTLLGTANGELLGSFTVQ